MAQDHRPMQIAVIGAGPAGLALALLAARKLPTAEISLFDARPAAHDVSADPRTLALALGSVQWLQQLGAWPQDAAQAILSVHVSQAPPTWAPGGLPAELRLSAAEQGVPLLGAVVSYGALVSRLQAAWLAREAAEPRRLHSRFGQAVAHVRNAAMVGAGAPAGSGVEVDADLAESFDLAVVAEGGVFADQARKAVVHDYHQVAWVGTVDLDGAVPGQAVERFTRHGPVALLPLRPTQHPPTATSDTRGPGGAGESRPAAGSSQAALVWCVPGQDDPVAALSPAQRVAVLNHLLPPAAGRVTAVGPLKHFALGLNAERSLVDGAIVRIGNAAQTLHPVAGQGLNLGLRDAVVLVRALQARDTQQGPGLSAALRRLEWSRAPDRWAMIAATDFLARSFTWAWPGLPAARGLGLSALQHLPLFKGLLARQMMFGRR